MARPKRNAGWKGILSSERIFFTTAKSYMAKHLLQSERNALLFIDVLRCYVAAGEFEMHDFVVMPNHVHLLIEVDEATIERAMQLIKGSFSFRVKRECGYLGEVWQPGFSDERIKDEESFRRVREYIAQNPIKAGLVDSPEEYPYCYTYLAKKKAMGKKEKAQGLKPKKS